MGAPTYKPAPAYHKPAPAYHEPAPAYKPAPAYHEPEHHPAKYAFEYSVKDEYSKNNFGHSEQRDGYKVTGEYRVALPDGRVQVVKYTADENGYVADVSYEGVAAYPKYEPKPAYHAPHPAPAYHEPAPAYHAPAPAYHAPAPAYHAPAPTYKPAPEPAANAGAYRYYYF